MPAILRIFLYQTDASLSVLGSTMPYDVVGSGGPDQPPCHKVLAACGSATLCLGVGVSTLVWQWPSARR